MNKILRNIVIYIVIFSFITGILIFGILWSYSNNIPDYRFLKSYKPPVSSKVYSGDGDLVADFQKKKEYLFHLTQFQKM